VKYLGNKVDLEANDLVVIYRVCWKILRWRGHGMKNTISSLRPIVTSHSAGAGLTLASVLCFAVFFCLPLQAQTLQVIYNFAGAADGGDPYAGLTRDAGGNLYSTGGYGGTYFAGVVYKVDPKGNETVLYNFTGGTDGAYPESPVALDKQGNIYGTTTQGGSTNSGVVFKVDTAGNETVLHNFGGVGDGIIPAGGPTLDNAGSLYGVTGQGGSYNDGVIYKVDAQGNETVLHSFTGATNDGKYPTYTTVVIGPDGNLYGVTQEGGSADAGILYRLNKSGKLTILHNFMGGTTDGCNAMGVPLLDKADNFYGVTSSCGSGQYGTVWKVSKIGKETVLHNFSGGTADGQYPLSGVVMDTNGNLYGTTETGGSAGYGTAYRVSQTGKFTLIHSFSGPDGKYIYGSLLLSNGALYGTAQNGGSIGYGTVWKITR
jgi:uncharacterized repeat protein (TIGR03803 family)